MKNILRSLLCPALCTAIIWGTVHITVSGETENVFEIYTTDDLLEFADLISEGSCELDAVLMSDLDLSDITWDPMGSDTYSEAFSDAGYNGTFDGNNHTISNLSMKTSWIYESGYRFTQGLGFFNSLAADSVVKDLNLENINIQLTEGWGEAGVLAAYCFGTIENCTVSGKISGNDAFYAGGLVSYLDNGIIRNCTSDVELSILYTDANASKFGYNEIGGITGYNGGTIDGCTNYGDIIYMGALHSCGSSIAGIAGFNSYNDTFIRNCANHGNIVIDAWAVEGTDTDTVGLSGITSANHANHAIVNCFNTGSITGNVEGEAADCSGIASYYFRHNMNCWTIGEISVTSKTDEFNTNDFSKTDSCTCYFLNETAMGNDTCGQYFEENDLTNGKLLNELNRNVDTIADSSLRLWKQDTDTPVLSDTYWDETFQPVSEFTDLAEGSYYEDAVFWAVENGITYGTSETTFSPNKTCTRGEIVTFLYRANSSPVPENSEHSFIDVKSDSYYNNAVLWAVENGITYGTSDTTFSPNKTCSRAEIVTFLHRSCKSPAPESSEHSFTDVKSDSYYNNAVLWAVENGITAGTGTGRFSPNGECTRAQVVTFLYRTYN